MPFALGSLAIGGRKTVGSRGADVGSGVVNGEPGAIVVTTSIRLNSGSVVTNRPLEWSSTAPGVASVTPLPGGQARVTAVAPGTATITVRHRTLAQSFDVTILPAS